MGRNVEELLAITVIQGIRFAKERAVLVMMRSSFWKGNQAIFYKHNVAKKKT